MTAKEYLNQIMYLDCKIQEKEEKIKDLKEKALNTASSIGSERVQSGGSKKKIENAVCSYTALEAEIKADESKRRQIIESINLLPPFEATVLYKCYVSGKSLKEVTREVPRGYSWVTKTHSNALEHMQELIDTGKVKA